MKKILAVIALLCWILSLSGCANPHADVLSVVYLENSLLFPLETHEVHEAVETYLEETYPEHEEVDTETLQKRADREYVAANLYSIAALDRDVVILTETPEQAENPVVTNKWLYLAASIEYYRGNSFARNNVENELAVFDSSDCIQKFALYPWLAKTQEEEFLLYAKQIQAAALAYYGLSDLNAYPDAPVRFYAYTYVDGVLTANEYTVVGYYETEADKLLSGPVPADPTSPAYQTVLSAVKNPALYVGYGDDKHNVTKK